MLLPVNTSDPRAVEEQVRAIHRRLYPRSQAPFVAQAFQWVGQCFRGELAGYQAIDACYHNLEHTLQGTLCLFQLLEARDRAGARPRLTERWFELTLLAILFHDTGYLKERTDREGTGAKFTPIHVARSAEFAREFLTSREYAAAEIVSIQNMIRCTGANADLSAIPFQNEVEKLLGCALATADLLGQMAAPDYVDKLPVLFEEFAEAARSGYDTADKFATFVSARDLMRKTQDFWNGYVVPRINTEFMGLYRFLNDPYPEGPNAYVQRVEENLARLRRELEAVA